MRIEKQLFLFGLLILLVTGGIFSNSTKNSEASHAQSDVIVDLVELTIRTDEKEPREKLSFTVRKIAHFVEFAVLGICTGGFAMSLSVLKKRSFGMMGPAICLVVAGTDEFIQSFTDRTSSLKDVALDMCGSATGLLLVAIVVLMWKKRKA